MLIQVSSLLSIIGALPHFLTIISRIYNSKVACHDLVETWYMPATMPRYQYYGYANNGYVNDIFPAGRMG